MRKKGGRSKKNGVDRLFEISGISAYEDFETIKNKLKWPTKGETGKEKIRYVTLIDCDTNHLENIIYNVPQIYPITKRVILSILKERWKKEKLTIMDIKLKIQKWKEEEYSVDEIEKMLKSAGYEYE